MKKTLCLLALLSLSACSGMADVMSDVAGVGVVSQEKSTFDNATIIKSSPSFLAKEAGNIFDYNAIKLGANWSSAKPDYATLVLLFDSNTYGSNPAFLGLNGIEINIDGKITQHEAVRGTQFDDSGYNNVTKTIYTSSKTLVPIPYTTLKAMVSAKDCRIRIHSSKGYEESVFSKDRLEGGQRAAILSIRGMVQKIEVVRSGS